MKQLDKVKKAKQDLECEYAGVNMRVLANENREFEKLKQQTQNMLLEKDSEIKSLQTKLDW